MEMWYEEVEESLELLKSYFKNKKSQGAVELNGQDVLAAFDLIYNTISMPNIRMHNGQTKRIRKLAE